MAIPPELQQIADQAKQQMPELAPLPDDEVVALIILQAMQEQQAGPLTDSQGLGKMPAKVLSVVGEQLLAMGRWEEAERCLLQAIENAEKEHSAEDQVWAALHLGCLCRDRGDFPQAMVLFQQALPLAERIGDRDLISVIYENMGSAYAMQGGYSQAIEYHKKSLEIDQELGNEEGGMVSYGNLGTVYSEQGDYDRAIQAYKKSLEYSIKLGMDRERASLWQPRHCLCSTG